MSDANRARLGDAVPPKRPRVASRLVDTVVEGDVDPTPALTLRICVRGLSLDQAGATLLDPTNWTRVPEWCAMVPAPPDSAMPVGIRRYLEEVSLDCGGSSHRYRVWLDFSPVRSWGDRLVVTYRMSPPEVQRDLVVDGIGANKTLGLDEGSLVVGVADAENDDDLLRLITTKRLRHASDAVGRAAFVMADLAGFYELGARFVTHVSKGQAQVEVCPDANPNE
jgi:hypothetical protein